MKFASLMVLYVALAVLWCVFCHFVFPPQMSYLMSVLGCLVIGWIVGGM